MNKIIFYAVPNLNQVSGGPKTRITQISKEIERLGNKDIIIGSKLTKLRLCLKAKKANIVYVESSTNRMGLIDLFCFIILKYKCRNFIVYIRDVYIQLFPNEYKRGRAYITKVANIISNYIYYYFSDKLAFPTIEMGEVFISSLNVTNTKPIFSLPPGTFNVAYTHTKESKVRAQKKLKNINLLYLGGTKYIHSGFSSFLKLASELNCKYQFHILTGDKLDDKILNSIKLNNIKILNLPHKKVIEYLEDEDITFVIHSRPKNNYDDITFPIKIMDCISCGVPIISYPHEPLIELLGFDYPFFVNEISSESITEIMDNQSISNLYEETIERLKVICNESSYIKQVEKIINS